jgi:hypothetical protein
MFQNSYKFIIELVVITAIILAIGIVILYLAGEYDKRFEVFTGFFLSLVLFIPGFLVLQWAMGKSDKIFLGALSGGMFIRFILIAILIFFIVRFTKLNLFMTMISLFLFYIVCQFYEIRLIAKIMFKGKKWLEIIRKDS